MKSAAINFFLLCGSILLFFGSIEGALRVTGIVTVRSSPPRIYQRSSVPDISYELRPSVRARAYRATVTTNKSGFRSPEIESSKPLVAILGDSIAFGYGVEDKETIPSRLQALLPDVAILNAGVPGYNILQQRALYREKIRALRPSALLLIFHWNDVEEATMGIASLDEEGILRPQGWEPTEERCSPIQAGILRLLPGACWLDRHSALYIAMKKGLNARQAQRDLKEQERAARTDPFAENIRMESLERYARELRVLRQLLPRDLPRLFVIWPERHLHLKARPVLKEIARGEGFRILDLYEIFGNSPQTLPWDSVHPSPDTNAEAAQVIAATLEHYSLLP